MSKEKEFKIYITVPRGEDRVLLNCNDMQSMMGLTPTAEILATHFQAERVRVAIWERDHKDDTEPPYRPQPLYIETQPEQFKAIVSEIRCKVVGCNDLSHITLTLDSTLPCCIISEFHPDEYEKQSIK